MADTAGGPANTDGKPNGGTGEQTPGGDATAGRTPIRNRPIIDPAIISGQSGTAADSDDGSGGTGRRKRGRPAGSTSRARPSETPPLEITDILVSAHNILATALKSDLFRLDRSEAEQINEAINKVSRHYNVEIAAKTMDWCNLVTVLCAVYGTRIFTARMAAKAAAPAETGGDTIIIPGVGPVHGMQPGMQ